MPRVSTVLLVLCFASPVAVAQDVPANDPEVVAKVSVSNVQDDQDIQQRMSRILKTTGWFEDAQVEVRNGVVFLEGSATSPDRREWAADLARHTEGVVAVVNNLEVNRSAQASETTKIVVSSLKGLWQDFLAQSPFLIAGFCALVATVLISRVAQSLAARIADRSRLKTSMRDLVLQLLSIGIWVTGMMVAAVIMFPGLTPAKALTVLGLGSVAIGFAFKDIFENFFAGILILWKYPFDRGDFIECGDIKGRIEEISIRMCMIRQVDGQLVVVPNSTLFKNSVDVLTSQPSRRTTVICGVAYDTDLKRAQEVFQEALGGCASVNTSKPVEIFAREFGDSSINFEVTWWTGNTPRDIRQSRDEVVQAVKRALDDAAIEIPFPQRTLWLPEPVRTHPLVAFNPHGEASAETDGGTASTR